jgi:hypothetical protein
MMKTQYILTIGTLVLATAAAFVDQLPIDHTIVTGARVEVHQSVIDTRGAGQLLPAGEAAEHPRI